MTFTDMMEYVAKRGSANVAYLARKFSYPKGKLELELVKFCLDTDGAVNIKGNRVEAGEILKQYFNVI